MEDHIMSVRGREVGSASGRGRAPARGLRAGRALVAIALVAGTSGCAAAVGAAVAASEIRQGLAGVQQLLSFSKSIRPDEVEMPPMLATPLAGTYRGFQALGSDTVHYYIRTAQNPIAPIIDDGGAVTGYALPGLAAASLDTLEARVRALSDLRSETTVGRTIYFVEGTQPANQTGRTLYPGAFLGRVAQGESRAADRQNAELRRLKLEMDAPEFRELEGRGIPHELFGTVAEGIFTVRADGSAVYHQEYEVEDGRTLVLHFERISRTTLP